MQTIPDSETPIFQELNAELGELPEINIHDFEEHSFGFVAEDAGSGATTDGTATAVDGAETAPTETSSEHPAADASNNTAGPTSTSTKNAAGLAPVADAEATETDSEPETDSESGTEAEAGANSGPENAVKPGPRKGGRRRKSS